MIYNSNDAQYALDRLGALLSSDTNKPHEAGKRLLQQLAQLKKPAGIDRIVYNTDAECIEIRVRGGGFRRIWIGGRDMKFKICESEHNQNNKTTRDLNAAVAYDPGANCYVGTEDDSSIVQTPGTKRIKRDALAVVIDAIAEDILSAR